MKVGEMEDNECKIYKGEDETDFGENRTQYLQSKQMLHCHVALTSRL